VSFFFHLFVNKPLEEDAARVVLLGSRQLHQLVDQASHLALVCIDLFEDRLS
jgi:hypothetical protein